MNAGALSNAMTVDVEDYFQVSAFAPHIPRASWPSISCRVEANIDLILKLFDANHIKGTFFTLGWIAERYPSLVKRISENGHELASHGYGHLRASDQSPEEFFDDVTRSKHLIEDISGQVVKGYRAPSFSIGTGNLWALDTLKKAGYEYSSSIYPVAHDHYGMPGAPRFPFYPRGEEGILEVPITTVRLFNKNFPAGGGGYFRLLPYQVSRGLLAHVNRVDNKPGIFYFHPWEVDPAQPRQQNISFKTKFRHYINLGRTETRLKSLAQDFRWGRMDQIFLKTS